jgi:hypothetical protein
MLAAQAAALRPRPDSDAVIYATKLAMRSLGRRVLGIDEEIARLEVVLGELVTATAPGLVGLYGVGVDTAAILCVAAGDNPQRVRSEAAWAHLCGVAPLEATSGKVTRRHRLNRGGNRQANHALWRLQTPLPPGSPRLVCPRVTEVFQSAKPVVLSQLVATSTTNSSCHGSGSGPAQLVDLGAAMVRQHDRTPDR